MTDELRAQPDTDTLSPAEAEAANDPAVGDGTPADAPWKRPEGPVRSALRRLLDR